jgi:hypothetical protein
MRLIVLVAASLLTGCVGDVEPLAFSVGMALGGMLRDANPGNGDNDHPNAATPSDRHCQETGATSGSGPDGCRKQDEAGAGTGAHP